MCYTAYGFLSQDETTIRTHRTILRGDRLEWLGEAPESQTEASLSVQVIILEQEPLSEEHAREPAMAALLEPFLLSQPLSGGNPELHQDRVLPARDG